MKSLYQTALVLFSIQAFLTGTYFFLKPTSSLPQAGQAIPNNISGEFPLLRVSTHTGQREPLTLSTKPALIHVWATWCLPCREELPGLLALASEYKVDVIAIALDPEWDTIEQFFDGRLPPQVVMGDAGRIQSLLKVHALPVTFLVDVNSQLKLRFEGAQQWEDREFTEKWLRGD